MALRLVAKARAEGASKNILTFIGLDDGEHYSPQFRRVRAMSFSISDIVKPSATDATMVSPALGHRTSTSTPSHSAVLRHPGPRIWMQAGGASVRVGLAEEEGESAFCT